MTLAWNYSSNRRAPLCVVTRIVRESEALRVRKREQSTRRDRATAGGWKHAIEPAVDYTVGEPLSLKMPPGRLKAKTKRHSSRRSMLLDRLAARAVVVARLEPARCRRSLDLGWNGPGSHSREYTCRSLREAALGFRIREWHCTGSQFRWSGSSCAGLIAFGPRRSTGRCFVPRKRHRYRPRPAPGRRDLTLAQAGRRSGMRQRRRRFNPGYRGPHQIVSAGTRVLDCRRRRGGAASAFELGAIARGDPTRAPWAARSSRSASRRGASRRCTSCREAELRLVKEKYEEDLNRSHREEQRLRKESEPVTNGLPLRYRVVDAINARIKSTSA